MAKKKSKKKEPLGRLLNTPNFKGNKCPFCGNPDLRLVVEEVWDTGTGVPLTYTGFVTCTKCLAQGPKVETGNRLELVNQVAMKWNTLTGSRE